MTHCHAASLTSCQELLYTDHIDAIGRLLSNVTNNFLAIEKIANSVGLKVNRDKRKYNIEGSYKISFTWVQKSDNNVSLEMKRHKERIFNTRRYYSFREWNKTYNYQA